MSKITPIIMPKWGLTMEEGTVGAWLVEVGTQIEVGMPILDVETEKLTNAVEATDAGLLRRQFAQAGETLPVKSLLGIMADESVSDAEIEQFIANWVPPSADELDDETLAARKQKFAGGFDACLKQNGVNLRLIVGAIRRICDFKNQSPASLMSI